MQHIIEENVWKITPSYPVYMHQVIITLTQSAGDINFRVGIDACIERGEDELIIIIYIFAFAC